MLLTLGVILLIVWAVGFFAFKVTLAAIHLLVVLALVAIVLHFARRSRVS